jgi:ribose transport system ATP-binding protein
VLLAAKGLTRTYGSTRALRDVSFTLAVGEIVGFVGENGSGKSTLLRLLAGVEVPDRGSIEIDGEAFRADGLSAAARRGIGLVFQELSQIASLSVFENFFLRAPSIGFRAGVLSTRRLKSICREIFDRYDFDCDPAALVGSLPFHQRQLLEIIREIEIPKLLGAPRSILLLDEPTTALSQTEAERVAATLRSAAAAGAAVIFISHRLNETMALCDRILTLRDGMLVAERARGETSASELQTLMVGREAATDYFDAGDRAAIQPDRVLELRQLGGEGFDNVGLSVRKSEIIGLAGLESSGKSELCEAVHGLRRIERGELSLHGRAIARVSPAGQVARGVAYVPKERLSGGIIADETIERNVGLQLLNKRLWVNPRRERGVAQNVIRQFRVKAASTASPLRSLSGGNQQKVTLGKWLINAPSLIVLDNPTRGVDIGARAEIYRSIRQAAAAGAGILIASDELGELLGLCDRIYVMKDQRIAHEIVPTELAGEEIDRERAVIQYMV